MTKDRIYRFIKICTGLWVTRARGREGWILCFWKNQTAINEPYVYKITQKIKFGIYTKFNRRVIGIKIIKTVFKSDFFTLPDGKARLGKSLLSVS